MGLSSFAKSLAGINELDAWFMQASVRSSDHWLFGFIE